MSEKILVALNITNKSAKMWNKRKFVVNEWLKKADFYEQLCDVNGTLFVEHLAGFCDCYTICNWISLFVVLSCLIEKVRFCHYRFLKKKHTISKSHSCTTCVRKHLIKNKVQSRYFVLETRVGLHLIFFLLLNIIIIINLFCRGENTQKNSNTLQPMDEVLWSCISICLDCTKYNEINMHFWCTQKHATNIILHE